MHFILDSSIFIAERFGASAHLSALLFASRAVGYTVHIPRPALEEIVAAYSRRLESSAQKASATLVELSRLLGRDVDSSIADIDIAQETQFFRDRLSEQLMRTETKILDYPAISYEQLVRQATSRRRPFNEKGAGFRDALIWHSVLELASNVADDIVLVSSDKDFAGEHGQLHDDLKEDLANHQLSQDKVVLASSLADLVEKRVRPKLGMVPWERPIEVLAQGGWNLEDSIGMTIQDACLGRVWEPKELGLPHVYEDPDLDIVEGVSDLTVADTRSLPSDQLLMKINAKVDCVMGVFIYKPDWYLIEDDRMSVDDDDWNDHYVRAGISLTLDCELDLVLDVSNPAQPVIRDVSVQFQTPEND